MLTLPSIVKPRIRVFALAAVAAFGVVAATPQPAAQAALAPSPSGVVVSDQQMELGTERGMPWRVVASKQLLGSNSGTSFYQWVLSLYALDGSVYRLRYRSPGNGGPLSRVEQATGGVRMWFPLQSLTVVGPAKLMQLDGSQLVVETHESGADCGNGIVTVFATGSDGNVAPAVTFRNGCELTVSIDHATGGDRLVLHGPYYGPNAPLCCATKRNASATVAFRNGQWLQTPKYYEMHVGKFPST
jgi:hypothetical protein